MFDINQIEIGDIVRDEGLASGRVGVVVSCLKSNRVRAVFYSAYSSKTYQSTKSLSQIVIVERGRDRCRAFDEALENKHATSEAKPLSHEASAGPAISV